MIKQTEWYKNRRLGDYGINHPIYGHLSRTQSVGDRRTNNMTYEKVEQEQIDFWKPQKVEDFIEGKIVEVRDSKFGNTYVLLNDEGKLVGTPSHKVLQNLLLKLNVGDRVKIVLIDLKESGKGNPTMMYDVFVDNQ